MVTGLLQSHENPLPHLSVLGLQPAVPVPAGEEVVRHEARRRDDHEAAADPKGVCCAPDPLPHHLGVARDAHDARLPHVQLRLVHCRNLVVFKKI